jgi:hypothetical protein
LRWQRKFAAASTKTALQPKIWQKAAFNEENSKFSRPFCEGNDGFWAYVNGIDVQPWKGWRPESLAKKLAKLLFAAIAMPHTPRPYCLY